VLELAFCRHQQLGALQQAFFHSSDVSGVDIMVLRMFVWTWREWGRWKDWGRWGTWRDWGRWREWGPHLRWGT
jgi:hypothetical protein